METRSSLQTHSSFIRSSKSSSRNSSSSRKQPSGRRRSFSRKPRGRARAVNQVFGLSVKVKNRCSSLITCETVTNQCRRGGTRQSGRHEPRAQDAGVGGIGIVAIRVRGAGRVVVEVWRFHSHCIIGLVACVFMRSPANEQFFAMPCPAYAHVKPSLRQ